MSPNRLCSTVLLLVWSAFKRAFARSSSVIGGITAAPGAVRVVPTLEGCLPSKSPVLPLGTSLFPWIVAVPAF